ncbi:MAG: DUF2726 domain-containing protein [Chloroflexaceae bacterium]|nr:DUF2726 domain-containing protein [Chloroflexaceae bacterium]NJO05611.1 DUF2726 domain-containing protein [Chloroflexaceae bacterium]
MSSENKFGVLRKLLEVLGLSQQSTDDVVNFIVDLLAGERKGSTGDVAPEFPYHLRDHFLSPAELHFYSVMRTMINGSVTICTKVGLQDIFYVKPDDPSRYRIYTNKIDRKHVDFLLCNATTMQPLVGIELDDKTHQRKDRQERDAFVDSVFKAAGLPLVHIPVRRAYRTEDIRAQLSPYLGVSTPVTATPVEASTERSGNPICPICGSNMVLRTAKQGANAGHRFWGCSNYPACRSLLPYKSG